EHSVRAALIVFKIVEERRRQSFWPAGEEQAVLATRCARGSLKRRNSLRDGDCCAIASSKSTRPRFQVVRVVNEAIASANHPPCPSFDEFEAKNTVSINKREPSTVKAAHACACGHRHDAARPETPLLEVPTHDPGLSERAHLFNGKGF